MYLSEALQYHDMDGQIKPTIFVDEFSSKMGDDEDIIVLSFYVRQESVADDLVSWFEKGYDWVLDADRSPGEIKPSRYLVFVEMRRRSNSAKNVAQMLGDLDTLTDIKPDEWIMTYKGKTLPFNQDSFALLVPSSPKDYRISRDRDLNEMRSAAGITPKKIHEISQETRQLQSAAGI